MRLIILSLVFLISLADSAAANSWKPEIAIRPQCPADLAFHCEILENAWIQPLETIVAIGGYVCRRFDPEHTRAESINFFAAVKAYYEAKKQMKDNSTDMNSINQFDKAEMDLKLAAKALRSIVGVLSV